MSSRISGDGFIIVGRIARAHGIRGELLVDPLTDDVDSVFSEGRRVFTGDADGEALAVSNRRGAASVPSELTIDSTRTHGDRLLLTAREIPDRSAAELLNGFHLLLPATEVAQPRDGEAFVHELVGMRVLRDGATDVGEVAATLDLPQGLMIEIRRADGSMLLFPFIDETIVRIDREKRELSIVDLAGLLDL
jgi:16S rRNA processing protein RimM